MTALLIDRWHLLFPLIGNERTLHWAMVLAFSLKRQWPLYSLTGEACIFPLTAMTTLLIDRWHLYFSFNGNEGGSSMTDGTLIFSLTAMRTLLIDRWHLNFLFNGNERTLHWPMALAFSLERQWPHSSLTDGTCFFAEQSLSNNLLKY